MSDPQRRCITCEEEKPVSDFSLEHIFPDSLGGYLCSDLFKTHDVCRDCNSTMGMFVDGPMIRNWFSKQEYAAACREFIDWDSDSSWTPFTYMGPSDFIELPEDEVCEIWIGPSGEHVYHIHDKDKPEYGSYAGGNPIARKKDPGRAYLFLTSENMKRVGLVLRSFVHEFKKAKRFAGNFAFPNERHAPVHAMSSEFQSELDALMEEVKNNKPWRSQLIMQLGYEERFLAKLARSLGYKLFGSLYLETNRAKELKQALWERDRNARALLLKASPIFDTWHKTIAELLGISGAYVVFLHVKERQFWVTLILSKLSWSVAIADDPSLWSRPAYEKYNLGDLYIVAPQANFFFGPVHLPEFFAHKQGIASHENLACLDALRAASKKSKPESM